MSLIRADARLIPLVDRCAQMCVTSPPYWGLRDYGVAPSIWGGDDCPHAWGPELSLHKGGPHGDGVLLEGGRSVVDAQASVKDIRAGQFCRHCGAWLGCLGLEPTPELYVQHLVDIFADVWRVLKDDGVLWLNLGDCYATGAGAVGECPGGGAQGARWRGDGRPDVNGRGEPQKPQGYKGDRGGHEGKHAYRVGPMTQPNRLPIPGLKPKDLVGVPWLAAFALRAAGWYLRGGAPWLKRNVMPESVKDRPASAVEYLFLFSKQESYFYDEQAVKKVGAIPAGTRAAKGSNVRSEVRDVNGRPPEYWEYTGQRNRRNSDWFFESWQGLIGDELGQPLAFVVNTRPYSEAHFATFPPALVEPCILSGSRPGDLVLDNFIGSGTTGAVAERLMRRWVGTDLSYQHLAKKRTAQRGLRLETEASA